MFESLFDQMAEEIRDVQQQDGSGDGGNAEEMVSLIKAFDEKLLSRLEPYRGNRSIGLKGFRCRGAC